MLFFNTFTCVFKKIVVPLRSDKLVDQFAQNYYYEAS